MPKPSIITPALDGESCDCECCQKNEECCDGECECKACQDEVEALKDREFDEKCALGYI